MTKVSSPPSADPQQAGRPALGVVNEFCVGDSKARVRPLGHLGGLPARGPTFQTCESRRGRAE